MTAITLWERWAAQTLDFGVTLTADQIDRFRRYEAILLEWNSHTNLTAIRDPADIRQRHFLDAFSCVNLIQKYSPDVANRNLIDVGTGAGFPGLPLKIIFPELAVTLVDSVGKKTAFLSAAVDALGLDGVAVIHDRAEICGQQKEHRERYDWAVARSVAQLNTLAELLLPLVKVGGFMLAQKGETGPRELLEAARAIHILGGEESWTYPYQLPGRDHEHVNVVIAKKRPTPAKYPRRVGLPRKNPIKN